MSEYRNNFVDVYIGYNRTGKTAIAELTAKEWRKIGKGSVISFDPQNRLSGVSDEKIESIEDIDSNTINSLFIFDDYKALFEKDKMDNKLLYMLIQREEHCNDFIFITHAPSMVLERLTYYVSNYYMFYTQSTDKGFNEKIQAASILKQLRTIINNYVKLNGVGEYPRFPHVVFDTKNESVYFVNVNL